MDYRYFKCNVLGGFRISDLNRNIKQNDYFFIESHICDTSRAVRAAITNKWMVEIDENEASQHILLPKKSTGVIEEKEIIKPKIIVKSDVAIPYVQTQTLESRQTEKNMRKQATQKIKKEEKVIIPDFNKAEKAMKARQADIMTKGEDETLKSPAEIKKKDNDVIKELSKEITDNEVLSMPNFDEKKEETKFAIKEELDKKIRRKRKMNTEEIA
jgi:hypothetical protein